MDNLTTTISFSVYSNKGIYALLLGSGISKSSGIPTGWDIVKDLIKRIATLENEECFPDPETWYMTKFEEEPDYSNLLSKLVKTPSERINLLRPYIEANEEDREQGLKIPTKAHYAIANLVKKGYIKVIITTNFDRLIETALQSVGIEPTVIKNSFDIDGTMPLVHNDFTLIKVNGDYLDSRFLNTKNELEKYDKKMHNFLSQIINEYGIISCGWSAVWDLGLIRILDQCQSFKFGSYWAYKDICEKQLEDVAIKRKGQLININDADTFFTEIYGKIEALESINDNHPLNAEIALARLKKYIVKEEHKILLHDLIFAELEEAKNKINRFEDLSLYPNNEHFIPLIRKYESSIDIALKMTIHGVYWSKPEHNLLFKDLLSRISEPVKDPPGRFYQETRDFHYYPSMLIIYALGISSLKVQKYELLNSCFQLKISERDSDHSSKLFLIQNTNPWLIDPKIMNSILNTNYKTPLSTYVNQMLRPYFKEIITNDQEFNLMFDIFEYILGWYYLYLTEGALGSNWVPYGQYKWRSYAGFRSNSNLFIEFFNEAEVQKDNWLPIKGGMFGGNYAKYLEIKEKLDKFLNGFHI
jgi:hypothetical protein